MTVSLVSFHLESFCKEYRCRNCLRIDKENPKSYVHSLPSLFLPLLRRLRHGLVRRLHEAIRVVNLPVLAQQLLLARLIVPVSSDLVAVFFGLEEGGEVDAGPNGFAAELAINTLGLLGGICGRRPGSGRLGERWTYFCSRMPLMSLYQPYVMTAPMPRSMIPGRNPFAGRLRCNHQSFAL